MKAIHLTAYGEPTTVLQLVDIPEPAQPGLGQVLIRVEYAPINPSDLMLARQQYFLQPTVPAVIGGEGVGTIISVGSDVKHLQAGQRVTIPFLTFSWAEKVLAPADQVLAISNNIDVKQAAMLNINPTTAVLLLNEFVKLKFGSWVALNAANSGVGRSLIAIAKARGIKTICVVRRAELREELLKAGANFVGVESPELAAQVLAATGGEPIELGLDAVGGSSTGALASLLTTNSQIIVYAMLSGKPIEVSQLDLVGKKMRIQGFWMYYDEFLPKLAEATLEGAQRIADGTLTLPITAIYKPEEISKAAEHADRGGKVLLNFSEQ